MRKSECYQDERCPGEGFAPTNTLSHPSLAPSRCTSFILTSQRVLGSGCGVRSGNHGMKVVENPRDIAGCSLLRVHRTWCSMRDR